MPAFTEPRMGNHWSVDLRHYLLPEGKPARLSPRGRRLFEYWTEIVSQATQYDDPTTLLCRRRPGRQPCKALLTIFFDIDTNDVLWFCPLPRRGPHRRMGEHILGQWHARAGKAVVRCRRTIRASLRGLAETPRTSRISIDPMIDGFRAAR